MVVINGPEATAGSTLNLLATTGIITPTTLEMFNVSNNETAIMAPNIGFP